MDLLIIHPFTAIVFYFGDGFSDRTRTGAFNQKNIERFTKSNNIEVCEEPVSVTKKLPCCAIKLEAGEENRTVQESLYWGVFSP